MHTVTSTERNALCKTGRSYQTTDSLKYAHPLFSIPSLPRFHPSFLPSFLLSAHLHGEALAQAGLVVVTLGRGVDHGPEELRRPRGDGSRLGFAR